MTEENKEEEAERIYISDNDFERYVKAKEINPECPRCKKIAWALQGDDNDNFPFAWPVVRGKTISLNQVGFIFTLLCRHCFYIWTLSYNHLEKWVEDNPQE